MSFLDKKVLLKANLETRSITEEKQSEILFYNTDENIANLYMKLIYVSDDGLSKELQKDEVSGYSLKLTAIKPKTNQIREVDGVLSEDLNNEETCAIFKFQLGTEFTNQIGSVICCTKITKDTQKLNMNHFVYTIKADKLTGLNAEIESNPDLPVLKGLIEEVKETAQTVNNIDNVNVSDIKTYSNKKIEEKFSGVSSQIKEIVKDVNFYGANPSLNDNTDIIQKCLDMKGHIKISKPGTYFVRGLKIDSDTTFECLEGVTIKLIENTRNYVLTNKDYINRNKNIKLIGGIYDNNSENGNDANGAYSDISKYCGFGIHLENIQNLEIKNVKGMNSSKYSISICKAENVRVENISFDTFSDGIHFQPPLRNCVVDTVTGSTGDDMVSFTLGDYSLYRVSSEGNFENIEVKNVDAVCKEHNGQSAVKVTGSGLNNEYYFKNFKIKNIYGNILGVNIEDDLYDTTSNDLKLTKVIDFELENIVATYVTPTNRRLNILLKNTGGGNIVVNKCNIKSLNLYSFIKLEGCKLDSLTLNDVKKESGANGVILDYRDGYPSILTNLYINNLKYDMAESRNFYALDLTGHDIKNLYIKNIQLNGSGAIGGGLLKLNNKTDSFKTNIYIDNFELNVGQRKFLIMSPVEIYISNGRNNTIDKYIKTFYVDSRLNSDLIGVRVNARNVNGDMTVRHIIQDGSNICPISINMDSGNYNERTDRLTPKMYDKVICTTDDSAEQNKGYVIWNEESWVKLA